MGDDYKAQIRDYWKNYKRIFPRKTLEDGKRRTERWAVALKKELKLDKEMDENWESHVNQWLDELEGEWGDW